MGKKSRKPPKQVGTQTVTEQAEPWGPQQPFIKFGMDQAMDQYKNPAQYFPDAGYVPFSPQSEMGLRMMQGRAMAGSPVQDAAQQSAQNTMGGNYLNNQPGQGAFNQAINAGGYDPSAGYLGGQMNRNPNANPAMGYLHNTASGGMLNANPWLDREYEKAGRGVQGAINSAFGGGGRTGSEAHASSLGTGMADLATGMYGQNYQNERDRMQNAAGQIQGAFDNSMGRGLQAANQMTSGYNQGMNRALQGGQLSNNAFQQERNNMMQSQAMAPQLAQMDYNDIDRMMQAGGLIEGKAGEQLQDRMNRYNYYQGLPQDQLNQFVSVMSGQPGGQSTTRQFPVVDNQSGGGSLLSSLFGGK